MERALIKYSDAIRSEVFARYEKEFAQRISCALSQAYLQEQHEVPMVEIVENVVNSIEAFTMKDSKTYFELSTRSIFIHGNKSQVEFDYYGKKVPRELGDLIFIISVVFNGAKYFEKFTINQFKKDTNKSKNLLWNIGNKEQLYFLSRFPTFRGVGVRGSMVTMREHTLPNYSGCLGSYGLLYEPGDFAFVSATELDAFIGNKGSIKLNELYGLSFEAKSSNLFTYFPYPYPEELLYLMDKFHRHYPFTVHLFWNLLGNFHHAYNLFEFAHKYLTLGIGEPIFVKRGIQNSQARFFLRELLSATKIKAEKEKSEKSEKLRNFVEGFFRYCYIGNENEGEGIGFEGGGIGIVHTIVNLGE